MSFQSLGSAVYLSNVDDYNGLSQACINPIFTSTLPSVKPPSSDDTPAQTTTNTTTGVVWNDATNITRNQPPSSDALTKIPSAKDVVLPTVQPRTGMRSRRSRPRIDVDVTSGTTSATASMKNDRNNQPLSTTTGNAQPSDIVTATIADCLACSGCITTAETIMLQEQHSLTKLKELLLSETIKNGHQQKMLLVVSLSPATIADLCRFLQDPVAQKSQQNEEDALTTNTSGTTATSSSRHQRLLQWTTTLHKYLHVAAVLDCTVTLHTTLQIAAQEFCHAFEQHNNTSQPQQPHQQVTVSKDELYEQQLLPSVAISSHQTQYWIPPPSSFCSASNNTKTLTEIVHRGQCTIRTQQSLPIVSSSCPAVVCLVEKSYPAMVPHLSTVISPMIASSYQFWFPLLPVLHQHYTTTSKLGREEQNTDCSSWSIDNHECIEYYHLAVMPCHDKKLEASRKDFQFRQPLEHVSSSSSSPPPPPKSSHRPVVDMVITTMELVQLLYDAIVLCNDEDFKNDRLEQKQNQKWGNVYEVVRQTVLSVPITSNQVTDAASPIIIDCPITDKTCIEMKIREVKQYGRLGDPYLFTQILPKQDQKVQSNDDVAAAAIPTPVTISTPTLHVTGSGGYADYIFRFAAKYLFHLDCPNDTSIWNPINDEDTNGIIKNNESVRTSVGSVPPSTLPLPTRKISARTARHRKQREYYEAIIYRNHSTNQYHIATTSTSTTNNNENTRNRTIVLRFVIAYGMSTVQHALSKLTNRSDAMHPSAPKQRLDYIECMACTHSCLNGNGQIRESANVNDVIVRETPSDVKIRVQQMQYYYSVQQHCIPSTTTDEIC
jgi:iron only hydrogenase large subunit-like protein